MPHPRLPLTPLILAIALALSSSPLLAPSAHAQTASPALSIELPAQPLGTALNELARQAGLQLMVHPDLVEGRQAPAVSGRLTPQQALTRLLAGSGLVADIEGVDVIVRPMAPAVATLATVTVSGKAPGSTTEGTGLYTTESTSSSTRLNLSQAETPQSVTVVTRQRMDDQKLQTVVDVLDATAGVFVQRETVGQDTPMIFTRGHAVENYQIDGVPVSSLMSPFLSNTAAFDRVEIVRGATGIMNGLGTPAATVNMVRKRPTAEPQVELNAQLGNWSRYGAGLDASGALNADASLRGRFVADYSHERAWVDRYRLKSLMLYGIGELDLTDDTLLTAGFSHLDQDSRAAIQGRPLYFADGTPTAFGPKDNTSQPWRFYDHTSSTVFASLEHRLASTWVAKAEYSYTRYHYDGLVAPIWAAADASGAGSRLFPNRWNSKPRQHTLDAYVTGTFPLFGQAHELIAGVTISRLRANGVSYTRDGDYSTNINYYDWADAPTPVFTESGTSHQRQRQNSLFFSTRLSVTDATSVLLGGRLTQWKLEGGDSSGYTYGQDEKVFVPYVGVVHALDDTWSVYGSYTKIFRPQDYGILEFFETMPEPEEGVGYEAGIKATFAEGRITSSLALFHTRLKNMAVWNADAFGYDILGETRTRGVELELNGELARGWQVSAGYALSNSENPDGQRVLTYVPRQSVKLFTSYRLPGQWQRLNLGGGIQWQSGVHTEGLAVDHQQGSVTLVDLMARYEVNDNLSVALNLNNVFNRRYFSSIANNYGTYGAERSVVASVRYRY